MSNDSVIPTLKSKTQRNEESIKKISYISGIWVAGTIKHWESVLAALVQIKVATGALESQKEDNTQKGNGFKGGGHRSLLSPYPPWLFFH